MTRVVTRRPKGQIDLLCKECGLVITVGGLKCKNLVTFVHTYRRKRWIRTEVFHHTCYERSAA